VKRSQQDREGRELVRGSLAFGAFVLVVLALLALAP
jgi:hypothetical protein